MTLGDPDGVPVHAVRRVERRAGHLDPEGGGAAGLAGGATGLTPWGATTYHVKVIGGRVTSSWTLPLESIVRLRGLPSSLR
jgi:hypothetical protein